MRKATKRSIIYFMYSLWRSQGRVLFSISFQTFLSDQHPVMMASISFICFVLLFGLTGAKPAADESMKSRNLVNGQENEPRMQYDSIQASPPVNGNGATSGGGLQPPVRDPRRPLPQPE